MRADTSTCAVACFTRTLINSHLSHILIKPRRNNAPMLLGLSKFPIMQLSSLQFKLSWLLLPAFTMALGPASDGSPTTGNDTLHLVTPQNLTTIPVDRIVHCERDPYDPDFPPYTFTSSLNHTFPPTPWISESFLAAAGLRRPGGDSKPFDCFVEIPGGIIVFEVCGIMSIGKGDRMQYSSFCS